MDTEDGRSGRLFTALVARLRTQYTFSARMYVRLIGQWVETDRDPSLYTFEVADKDGDFSGSALFAYKLNWQSGLSWATATRAPSTRTRTGRAERQLSSKSPTLRCTAAPGSGSDLPVRFKLALRRHP